MKTRKKSPLFENSDLFETPVSSKRVRNDVTAHQYRNGVININGQKYVMYSMTEAIKAWRANQKQK